MAVTFETTRAENSPNGSGTGLGQLRADLLRVQPPPGRRARLPEIVIGAALMVGFALAAVLWHLSTTDAKPALALSGAVSRGSVIKASDLHVVYVSSNDSIARLDRAEAASIVGRIALADLPAGTLLNRGSVASGLDVRPGEGLVGLALEAGQVPTSELATGDLVNVVAGPADGSGAVPADGRQLAVLASRASVFAAERPGPQGRRFVSLKLPEADANRVAAAAERGPVRLVLVGR